MRAVQYVAPGCVEVVDAPEPAVGDGEALVRIRHAAICGSDLHWLHDTHARQFPYPPGGTGHECVGTVVRAGPVGPVEGSAVLIIPTANVAFADYVSPPASRLIPLPDLLPSEHAVLAQQLGTVIFCVRKLTNVLDRRVVVVGQGPAGLLFTALLHAMGAREVIGVDLVEARLTVARRLGAALTIQAEREDPVSILMDHTGGMGADLVVEAVGKAETIDTAVALARTGGEVALFGVPKQATLSVNVDVLLRKNARLITSVEAQGERDLRSFRLAVRMIADGRIDVAPLVSHVLPVEEAPTAFDLALTRRDGAVKVLLDLS